MSSVKNKTSIPRNTFYIFVSQATGKFLSLLFVSIVARHLGTQGYGRLAFAFSFTYILTMFMDFGINTILVREIAREKEKAKEFLYNALLLKCILAISVFLLIFISVFLTHISYPTSVVIYIIGFAVITTSTAEIFRSAYFTAMERTEFRGILNIFHRLAELLLAILFIFLGGRLIAISLAILFASLLNFYLSWKMATRFLPHASIQLNSSLQKWIIKASLPIGVSIIFLGVYNRVDAVMLGFLKGDVAVGLYNAAYRLMEVLVFIPVSFSAALLPVISRYFRSSPKKFKGTFLFYLKWGFIVTLPISIIIGFFPSFFIDLIFSEKFQASTQALIILIWTLPLLSLNLIFRDYFIASNRQRVNLYFFSTGAILNIFLNFLFIPRWSFRGASISTLVTEFVGLLFLSFLVKVKREGLPLRDTLEKPLVSACGMATAIHYGMRINNGVALLSGIIVYILLLFLQETFSKEELQSMKERLFSAKFRPMI